MTGMGQVQRPTREEPEVNFLQPEPPWVLAVLPQNVPRGTSEPLPPSPPPTRNAEAAPRLPSESQAPALTASATG